MKTSVKRMDYDKVLSIPRYKHKNPKKINIFWRSLIRILTVFGMAGTKFKYEVEGLEELKTSRA